ncbi:MAG: trigger factor [Clostridiales Family XIII bacterium]|jgi:trigger factor|nr:trigger factor [Clostridiales Family XIII bacterium]
MNCAFIDRKNNEVRFSIDFSAKEFEDAQNEVYRRTKHQFKIDGFRNGKASRKMIELRYGADIFVEDAVSDMVTARYPDSVAELGLKPVDRPSVELGEINKEAGFSAVISVTVSPEVEPKGYKGIKVKKAEYPVADADVDAEIEKLRKRNARLVAAEKPAEEGDTVLFDYAGFIGEEQFEGGTAENATLVLGGGHFIPGFEEQLIGASAGDDRDVKVTFPEEYHADELAGKEAVFHCKVHQVKVEEKPELDDEFAQDVSDFDTADELKADIRKKLEEEARLRARGEMSHEAIEKLIQGHEIDIPNAMAEEQIDILVDMLANQLRTYNVSLESHMKVTNRDMRSLREELRPNALANIKRTLLLDAVATAEGLEASEAEIDERLAKLAAQYGYADDQRFIETARESNEAHIKQDIVAEKVIDLILDNAVITDGGDSAAEAGGEPDAEPAKAADGGKPAKAAAGGKAAAKGAGGEADGAAGAKPKRARAAKSGAKAAKAADAGESGDAAAKPGKGGDAAGKAGADGEKGDGE